MSNQSFLEQVAVNALGGILVALVAAVLALVFAVKFTEGRERRAAVRARDEVAAEEFYRAYGRLFAAWKEWDDFLGKRLTQSTRREDRAPFLNRVAEAEGMLESFLVRLTVERSLSEVDRDRLWCFRRGYKQVRYSVREGERVGWRRTPGAGAEPAEGYREYVVFKRLSVVVAAMIAGGPAAPTGDGAGAEMGLSARLKATWGAWLGWMRPVHDDHPTVHEAAANLECVTGRSEPIRARYGVEPRPEGTKHERDSLWYVIGDLITQAASDRPATHTR